MSARYQTQAINRDGGEGISAVPGGLNVAVSSPLGAAPDPDATNPEQLLALAWATCLNSTAQVIVGGARRTSVRVEVGLFAADPGPGYEFRVDAFVSVESVSDSDARAVTDAAHARCPVSKLLREAPTVTVHTEPYVT